MQGGHMLHQPRGVAFTVRIGTTTSPWTVSDNHGRLLVLISMAWPTLAESGFYKPLLKETSLF